MYQAYHEATSSLDSVMVIDVLDKFQLKLYFTLFSILGDPIACLGACY